MKLQVLPLLALALAVFSFPATAQTSESTSAGKAVVKNGLLTITTPTHELIFSEKPAWTIRQMFYNGKLLLSPTGAFGTVANSKGIGWEGTGHGYETVEEIELEVDEKTYPVKEGLELSGEYFTLKKRSRFGPYLHTSVITLRGPELSEKFDYEVVKDDSKVNFIYAFMHCMTNTTDQWIAELADHTLEKGKFLDDNSFTLQKEVRWVGAYSSSDQTGIVYLYPEVYKGGSEVSTAKLNSFWNRPRDNKLYFRPKLPRGIGTKFGYEVTLQAFNASPEEWEEHASKLITQLQEKPQAK